MGKETSTPPPPDYAGAAKETATGNLENSRLAAKANRVNYDTPYGSLNYSQNPADQDLWSAKIALSPDQQGLLSQQSRTSAGLAGLQDTATGRVADTINSPFQYGNVQDVQDQAYKGYTSRLDPQWQQRESALDTKLATQGITQGSEAYQNAQRDFNQGRNDAYQQANTAAIGLAPQQLQMASALRNMPLNELNALRTGAQVTNPSFQNSPQQNYVPGADMMGAANAQYGSALDAANAQNAASGNFMSGLFGLGAAGLKFSDVRLKKHIRRIGSYRGIGVYSFRYKAGGGDEVGLLAQEVRTIAPHAVSTDESGYLMVDYGAV